MCLIFWSISAWRAYKLRAYKKKNVYRPFTEAVFFAVAEFLAGAFAENVNRPFVRRQRLFFARSPLLSV